MENYRKITVNALGNVTVVRCLDKKIRDDDQIQVLGDELFSLIDEEHSKALLLNFQDVEIMSSAALGKLIRLDKKMKKAGGKLKLCGICPNIYEVFAITKLNKVFEIHPTERAALAAFC